MGLVECSSTMYIKPTFYFHIVAPDKIYYGILRGLNHRRRQNNSINSTTAEQHVLRFNVISQQLDNMLKRFKNKKPSAHSKLIKPVTTELLHHTEPDTFSQAQSYLM